MRDRAGTEPHASAVVPGPRARPSVAHTASRMSSRDWDADGIDDYRVIVTETFDAAGNLLSRTKDQDFDADGIIDSHVMMTFAGGVQGRSCGKKLALGVRENKGSRQRAFEPPGAR